MQQAAALGVAVVLALSDTASSFQVSPSSSGRNPSYRRHEDGAPGVLLHVSRFDTSRIGRRHCTSVRDLARSNGPRRKRNLRLGAGADSEETELVSGESSLLALGWDEAQAEHCLRWNRGASGAGDNYFVVDVGEGVGVSPLMSSQSTAAKTEIPTDVAVVGDPQKVGRIEHQIKTAVPPHVIIFSS